MTRDALADLLEDEAGLDVWSLKQPYPHPNGSAIFSSLNQMWRIISHASSSPTTGRRRFGGTPGGALVVLVMGLNRSADAMDELTNLLRKFAAEGARPTRDDARELQTLLEVRFPGGDGFPGSPALYEDLETAAACFRPGGSDFMYDEAQMAAICSAALAVLTQGMSGSPECP